MGYVDFDPLSGSIRLVQSLVHLGLGIDLLLGVFFFYGEQERRYPGSDRASRSVGKVVPPRSAAVSSITMGREACDRKRLSHLV